jgi:hypothetical protein
MRFGLGARKAAIVIAYAIVLSFVCQHGDLPTTGNNFPEVSDC